MNKHQSHFIKAAFLVLLSSFLYSGSLYAQLTDFEEVSFDKADSVAALYPKHSLQNVKILSDKLTKPFSQDIEKFRAIYRWVCYNIENDYGLYSQHKYRLENYRNDPESLKQWNNEFSRKVFNKLLNKHQTLCTGYAYIIRELAYYANLKCEIVHGYGRTPNSNVEGVSFPNHSWNAVELNGKWYLCDATWSSGRIDNTKGGFVRQFDEIYFLTDPAYFIKNHYPIDTQWVLLDSLPTLSTFLNAPLMYKNSLKHNIIAATPMTFKTVAKKGEKKTFSFIQHGGKTFKQARLQIYHHGEKVLSESALYENTKGDLAIDHSFTRKGNYIVHMMLDEDYVFSYKVKVVK